MSVTEPRMRLGCFTLHRPSKGVWVGHPAKATSGPAFLAPIAPKRSRPYDPRDIPELLQLFTRLPVPAEPEAYRQFSSSYGMLGLSGWTPREPAAVESAIASQAIPSDSPAPLECIADWERTVRELRAVGELHTALQAGDIAGIERCVELEGDWLGFSGALGEPSLQLWEEAGYEPIDLDPYELGQDLSVFPLYTVAGVECTDGDLIAAAWKLLAWAINTRTMSNVGYGLVPVAPGNFSDLELRLSTRSQLYGCLWLLLAEQVAAGRAMRRCEQCSTAFFQNPRARRQHGRFCSDRCRVAASRRRKKAAHRTVRARR